MPKALGAPARSGPWRPATSSSGLRLQPILLGVLLLASCKGAAYAPPSHEPPVRPDDGLLERPELQAVVELQQARAGGELIGLLGDSDPSVRARAAFALGSVQDPASIPALSRALRDAAAPVRRDAAFALGQTSDSTMGAALVAALASEPDRDARRAMVEALGKVAGSEAIRSLAAYPEPRLEADIALALSRALVRGVHVEEALERVLGNLTHPDASVRLNAAHYFGHAERAAFWSSMRRPVRLTLQSYAADDEAAVHLIQGLARIGDRFAVRPFHEKRVSSPDWRIRYAATAGLGQFWDRGAAEDLLASLDDPSPHVRMTASASLADIAPVDALIIAYREWVLANPSDWRTAGPLITNLARSDTTGFALDWIESWGRDDVGQWRWSLEALSLMDGEEATRTLAGAALAGRSEVSTPAADALVRRWRLARRDPQTHGLFFELFSEMLGSAEIAVAQAVVEPLTDPELRAAGSLDVLAERLMGATEPGGAELRVAIVEAIGSVPTPTAVRLLREAAEDDHPAVRAAAVAGLAASTGTSLPPALSSVGDGIAGDTPSDPEMPPRARLDWTLLSALGTSPRLILETDAGRIVVRLDPIQAPLSVQRIVELARAGSYDGRPFHRVEGLFVIQTGALAGDAADPLPPMIPSELTETPIWRGVVAMASLPEEKDSVLSEFFITHSVQPHLDGVHSVVGWVVEGMDVVDRIVESNRILSAHVRPSG